jgi:hypothetical protein
MRAGLERGRYVVPAKDLDEFLASSRNADQRSRTAGTTIGGTS